MDIRWLDDLLALSEAKTLTEAARIRSVTQPAFTRRIQQIEQWLGAPILDRTRRPVRVLPEILRRTEELRAMSRDQRALRAALSEPAERQHKVAIAAQHTISISLLPSFVAKLQSTRPGLSLRLETANREECYSLLMTRQVAIVAAYEVDGLPFAPDERLIVKIPIEDDEFCPVATPAVAQAHRGAAPLKILTFPAGSFFGDLFQRDIAPELHAGGRPAVVCETALAPAILAMALDGAGIAWLPKRLCAHHLGSGALVRLDPAFPAAPLRVIVARTTIPLSPDALHVWEILSS